MQDLEEDTTMRSNRGNEVLLNNKQEFSRSVLPEIMVTLRDKIKSREILDHVDRAANKLRMEVEDEEMVKNRKRFSNPGHRINQTKLS